MAVSPPQWDNLPTTLKNLHRWVLWKMGVREGKPTKVPVRADSGLPAETDNQTTWTTFEHAREAFEKGRGGAEGIGFVFARVSEISGVDLDHCRDPATGEIDTWAKAYLDRLNSYSEISPSGTGLHILVRGTIPVTGEDGGRQKDLKGNGYGPGAKIECYSNKRYFTMTGNVLPGYPPTVEDRQAELMTIYREIWGEGKTSAQDSTKHAQDGPRKAQDGQKLLDEIKERMFSSANGPEILKLYNGDISAYGGDDSRADLALCNHLAFHCNNNPRLMETLFRQSKLMRDKWDQARGATTYGHMTIVKAIADTTECYQGGGSKCVEAEGEDEKGEGGRGRPSTLKRIIEMLLEEFSQDSESRLVISSTGTYHLWITARDHREMFDISSERFRIWLAGKFAERYNGAILRTSAIKDGREALISLLMRIKPPVKMDLQVKTLKNGDSIYYDLGREDWLCIKISPAGVHPAPAPIGLRRTRAQGEQIEPALPAKPEDINLLTDKMRIKDEADALLIKAYTCAGMMPNIAHPILWLTGGQGSGKSMRAGMLKSVIDPATLKQTSLPDNRKDLGVLLSNAYCQGIDNVDAPFMSWQVEMLCQAVTGGASVARELFSDGEIAINVFNRAVLIFTSIAVVSNAPDLIDRAILLPVDELPEDERRSEVILMQEFDQDKPRILGAVFESIRRALAILPEVQAEFERREWAGVRMLDFAILGEALARGAWGKEPGVFLEAYRKRISEAATEIVSGDLAMSTLREFMRERIVWTGSAKTLLRELEGMNSFEDPTWRPPSQGWPKTPNALGMRLIKYSTDLARQGIKINRDRTGKRGDRVYEIELTTGATELSEDEKTKIEQTLQDHERRGTPLKIKEFADANNLDKTELARLIHRRSWVFAPATGMYLPPVI